MQTVWAVDMPVKREEWLGGNDWSFCDGGKTYAHHNFEENVTHGHEQEVLLPLMVEGEQNSCSDSEISVVRTHTHTHTHTHTGAGHSFGWVSSKAELLYQLSIME